ncbi:MAG: CoA transferase [Deltaproteobacteria bacterium]|nr:CoA transferase [Deltaproteobacteria bacterium]MBW2076764.1 CoA transferase [Deltaproteobacteria bacterium]MBW2311225.1 CoA transferase [Deltaproteobacteria bacterium]
MELFKEMTILSLEQATTLPYLTYRLAQDGMNVIRVEHPVYGDPNRMIGENSLKEERMYSYYLCINAGKKAITLNLAEEKGKEILRELIVKLEVDIFATNQLPRNYGKLGVDYEALKVIKPDIIWLGMTGFGPDINEAAYEPILEARSGLMEVTGETGEDPQHLGIPLADMGTSEHAYGLLMKALLKRERTGEGSRVDISMLESATSWLTVPITLAATFKKEITRHGNTHLFFAPVSVFKTKNGYVYIAVGNDRQWKAFVSLPQFQFLDKPEYEKNEGRIRDVVNLNRNISEVFEKLTSEELIEKFNEIGIPISKINTIPEVLDDPLIKRRLLKSRDPKSGVELTLAPPPNVTPFLAEHENHLSFPPRFGEHNKELYCDILGYSEDDLAKFKEGGIV